MTPPTFAYTQNRNKEPAAYEDSDYEQLQLCPSFIQWAMKQHAQFKDDVKPGKLVSVFKFLIPRVGKWWYTPIDVVSLFDKVLLHEVCLSLSVCG